MREKSLLVVDFDGTLVHLGLPTDRIYREVQEYFKARGIRKEFRPFLSTLEKAIREAGEETRQEVWSIIDRIEIESAAERCKIRAGTQEFLAQTKGRPIVLYSNNCREAVVKGLETVGIPLETFAALRVRLEPRSLKPSGEPIVEEFLTLAPEYQEEIFVLGDHRLDIQSAHQAEEILKGRGVPTEVVPIGIYRDIHRSHELDEEGAALLVRNLEEAVPFVKKGRAPFSLSMVILAFNEEKAISRAVGDADRFGTLYAKDHEVIVVDDGSVDLTPRILEMQATRSLKVIRHPQNEGMGSSMRDGYASAKMDFMAHLPGDRQVRPQSLLAYFDYASPENVVVSTYENPPSGAQRSVLSLLFRVTLRLIGGLHINFAGTYLFHRQWISKVHISRIISNTFVFSFDLLQRMADEGATIVKIRIRSFPRLDGRSREVTFTRILNVLVEIVRTRVNRWLRG
jgi:phosphoglycolate phosphatase-like HAD superfamily hydrolase